LETIAVSLNLTFFRDGIEGQDFSATKLDVMLPRDSKIGMHKDLLRTIRKIDKNDYIDSK
jgi:hypothetical protein